MSYDHNLTFRRDTPTTLSKSTLHLGVTGVLAMIHDAIAHMIHPMHQLAEAIPILQRIAQAVEDKHGLAKDIAFFDQDQRGYLRVVRAVTFGRAASVAIVRRDHHFISANDSYLKLFEFSRREIRVVRLPDLFDERDREQFLQANQELFRNRNISLAMVGRRMTAKGKTITTKSNVCIVSSASLVGGHECPVALHFHERIP